jgi:hypothetical protein
VLRSSLTRAGEDSPARVPKPIGPRCEQEDRSEHEGGGSRHSSRGSRQILAKCTLFCSVRADGQSPFHEVSCRFSGDLCPPKSRLAKPRHPRHYCQCEVFLSEMHSHPLAD